MRLHNAAYDGSTHNVHIKGARMPSARLVPAATAAAAANDTPEPPSPLDPQTYLDLYAAWLQSLGRTFEVKQPLSGDVTQWIRAWGEAVGQVGLFNFNVAGSSDPQAERRIGSRYSYGRQLGRLTEVLAPYIRANEARFRQAAGDQAVTDFLKMESEISRLKQASVEDIVTKVRQWQDDPDFERKLGDLLALLQGLKKSARSNGPKS